MYILRSKVKFLFCNGHLIPSHIKRVVAEWLSRWTCNLEAVRCWWFESYRGQGIFGYVHLFHVPPSWTGSVQKKLSMTFILGNRYIEREKDYFKSRETNHLKECAQALRYYETNIVDNNHK